ncbi:MAG: hypothetical protein LCH92_01615 [Proteobacteria bacterium]|nr:hypothetical protein [Pseudomonadota bacterium]
MDTPELPDTLLKAGAEYQGKLAKLGLRPEAMMWAYAFEEKQFLLWIVWSGLDRFGPLAIQRLLFQAYNASALPKEIDPFSVVIHSPRESVISGVLRQLAKSDVEAMQIGVGTVGDARTEAKVEFRRAWAYRISAKMLSSTDVSRAWQRFSANVDALAA